jgi:uncharacterized membrane protein
MNSIIETGKITELAAKQFFQAANVVGAIAAVSSAVYIWAHFGIVGDYWPVLFAPIAWVVGLAVTLIALIAFLRLKMLVRKYGDRSNIPPS